MAGLVRRGDLGAWERAEGTEGTEGPAVVMKIDREALGESAGSLPAGARGESGGAAGIMARTTE